MVPPAPDARASGALALIRTRSLPNSGLRCRETGFSGRRKKPPIRRSNYRSAVSETRWPYKNPAKSGHFARLREISKIARVRGGGCSAMPTCLFPANWEKQGEFREMHGDTERELAKNDQISIAWMEISLLKEQGGYAFLAGTSANHDHGSESMRARRDLGPLEEGGSPVNRKHLERQADLGRQPRSDFLQQVHDRSHDVSRWRRGGRGFTARHAARRPSSDHQLSKSRP
jgi:hypothetical protein